MMLLLGQKIIGMESRGREGLGVRPRREAGGLREAIETLVSSWTLVIGTGRDSPEGLYDRREFILDWGESSRGGEGGRGSPGVRAVADFCPGAKTS